MKNRRFLVIAAVGENSLHTSWMGDKTTRIFDLALVDYHGCPQYKEHAEYYFPMKGPKWHLISQAAEALGEDLNGYDYVWAPDDDLMMEVEALENFLNTAKEQNFYLSQPALKIESYVGHKLTLQRKGVKWRNTNLVEVMAPLFSQQAFQKFLPLFTKNKSSWGIDIVMSHLALEMGEKPTIVDEYGMVHTRPLNQYKPGLKSGQYANLEKSPQQELQDLLAEYGVNLPYKKRTTSTFPVSYIPDVITRFLMKRKYKKTKRIE